MAVRVRMSKNDFKPLADGRYEGVLTDPEITSDVPEGKHPYINFFFRTEDAALGERKVKMFYSFSPKAVYRLLKVFDVLEIPYNIVEEPTGEVDAEGNAICEETVEFEPEDIAGKSCIAYIITKTSTRDNKTYTNNEVKDIFAPV